jgi:RNA polymerase sigma-70 factor, ECF subfamily
MRHGEPSLKPGGVESGPAPRFGLQPGRPVHFSQQAGFCRAGLCLVLVRPVRVFRPPVRKLQLPPQRHNSREIPHLIAMSTIQSIAGENEQHPDVALVERVRAGDVSAYDELVRKYERQIFRIAQHITQNREDAQDVMQDAFLKAYEKLDQFQGNAKFYTWLVRIAVNESLMRLRKRRTGRMVSIDEDLQTEEGSVPRDFADWAPDPEQNYNQSELSEILRKTIQGLPQGFRVVFALRDVEGLSTEETAETLGLSVPAVKSRLLRARLQLRERLSRYFKRKTVPAVAQEAITAPAPQRGIEK